MTEQELDIAIVQLEGKLLHAIGEATTEQQILKLIEVHKERLNALKDKYALSKIQARSYTGDNP